jgi:hypothetical protein
LFSRVVTLACIPSSSVPGLFFLTSSPTSVVGGVFDDGYSNRGEVDLSVVLICISFMARDGEHFFVCFWLFEFLLLRKFYLVPLPISLLVH